MLIMNLNPVGMALYEHRDRCSSNAARDKRGHQDHGVEEFEIALDTYCVRASPLMSALRDLAPDVDLFYHNAVPYGATIMPCLRHYVLLLLLRPLCEERLYIHQWMSLC